MSEIAVRAEGLGKRYRIGARVRYRTLRESLSEALAAPVRRVLRAAGDGPGPATAPTIWALKDVSFEVKRGEVLGVIGRNGAGKSTLLKVLSRITQPTEGSAEIHGRVGSLLEVGTGFHPELTGRENTYLSGAILGMRKAEIDRKFDEIVAFAEVERFIDTPIKHYSTGMYLRLAFAVAAHLEPEILLVDEVLAVGDTAFQKKCLGKMGEVGKGGRTVVFVSHQLNQVRRLCSSCLWLDGGRIRLDGSPVEVLGAYEAAMSEVATHRDMSGRGAGGSSATQFLGWEIVSPPSGQPNLLASAGPCAVTFRVQLGEQLANGHHGIALRTSDGQLVWAWAAGGLNLPAGLHEFVHALPGLPLRPGVYHWQVSLYADRGLLDNWYAVPDLIIGTEPQAHPQDEWAGILNLASDFSVRSLDERP